MNDSPFELRWVEVDVEYGAKELRCVVCGTPVLTPNEGLSPDEFCEHILFVEDWMGELAHAREDVKAAITDANNDDVSLVEEQPVPSGRASQQRVGAEHYDRRRRAILNVLPSNSFVLEVVEPSRLLKNSAGIDRLIPS